VTTPTLVSQRLYFGLPALRLRDATGRVLMRVIGMPAHRATVNLQAFSEDFQLSTNASRELIEKMIQSGLLERLSPTGIDYGITAKFREYAQARIVEALPRERAQLLLTHVAEMAAQFNRKEARNKYEIETIAVFGSYMSLDSGLSELSIGITGRRRAPAERAVVGRATVQTEGTQQIRGMFQELSGYLRVHFFQQLSEAPRPFSVIFKAEN
jgi:DNA-binding IclR family transcriptional regulator